MPRLWQLGNEQVNEVIRSAVAKEIPLTVLVRSSNRWCGFKSRFVALRDERLLIEAPRDEGDALRRFDPAQKIGLSFKYKHHKHTCSATVAEMTMAELPGGGQTPVLSLCLPRRMQRLQRRAFIRAEVPSNRIVRASFWRGGKNDEPTGASAENPVHSGRVTDLSAGGFRMRSSCGALGTMEIGAAVGVRIVFGAGESAVFADAQLRHVEICDGGTIMGFQFIGLDQMPQGRDALETISAKVSEFQRAAQRVRAG